MNTKMDDQKIKVFLYDSIEMLAKLYQPETGIRVLELILNKIKKLNQKPLYSSHFRPTSVSTTKTTAIATNESQ